MSDIHDVSGTNPQGPSERPTEEDQAGLEKASLQSYIGDWSALQNGTIHRLLLKELMEEGIKPRTGQALPLEDPLARYKDIPLHARFLYTPIHLSVMSSIIEHYATIDLLSRNRCDIYLSLEQLKNPDETLDYLEYSPVLRESGVRIGYHDLPGIFFWDHQWKGEFISFGADADRSEINRILLRVFEEMREEPTIGAIKRVKKILRL